MSTVGELERTVSSYKYRICNFLTINKKTGECVYSPVIKVRSKKQDYIFCIKLYPYGDTDEKKDYLTLLLCHNGKYDSPVHIDVLQISILNKSGEIFCKKKLVKLPLKKHKYFKFPQFVERKSLCDPKNHALVNGSLHIQLDIIFDSNTAVLQSALTHDNKPVKDPIQNCKLKGNDDFEKLLDSENFSDMKVMIGEKCIYAHKAILTARSPVFKAMFNHQMKESQDGLVTITDVKYEVMKELIRFIYASKVNNMEKIAWDLLVAANKYCMDELISMCENSLSNSLNSDNAVDYLVLANSCNAEQLKSQVIKFINKNPSIVDQPNFKKLDSEIMYQVICGMAKKRRRP